MSDEQVAVLEGTLLDESHFDVCARDTTKILKPDGSVLAMYIKDVLPRNLVATAFEVLKKVNTESGGTNRGMAAGIIEDDEIDPSEGALHRNEDGKVTRFFPIKEDGTVSKTARAKGVPTAIIGYYGRYPRINYCRPTAFTQQNPELWQQIVPFFQRVCKIYKEVAPEQFAKQQDYANKIHPDFMIPGTCVTTVTVNRSWRTAAHFDAGDFKDGFGLMSAMEGGTYKGGEIIFPKYRAAVDMRTGGLCLFDPHELHGNAPLVGDPGRYLRMSCVMYLRMDMIQCGSMAFEMDRAKKVADQVATRHALQTPTLF